MGQSTPLKMFCVLRGALGQLRAVVDVEGHVTFVGKCAVSLPRRIRVSTRIAKGEVPQ